MQLYTCLVFNILVHSRTEAQQLWQNRTSGNMEFDFDGKCLRHPFTAMVCGATQSGKTCFVQKVLEHNQEIICPPPTRIMWCYGSYQPAYDEMLKTVKPAIEFFKGCPILQTTFWPNPELIDFICCLTMY